MANLRSTKRIELLEERFFRRRRPNTLEPRNESFKASPSHEEPLTLRITEFFEGARGGDLGFSGQPKDQSGIHEALEPPKLENTEFTILEGHPQVRSYERWLKC
jgi:hypothetical protein